MMVAEVVLGSTVYSVIGLRYVQVFVRVACFRHSCLHSLWIGVWNMLYMQQRKPALSSV